MHPKSQFQVVLVTAPKLQVARKLAARILGDKLAACVNILPSVESHYRWQGRMEKSGEVLMIIKTTGEQVKKLQRLIEEHHPYEIPEFIALPIDSGSNNYLKWIEESVHHGRD